MSTPSARDTSYDPFAEVQRTNPFPVWERARAESPVFYNDVLNAWVVTRYEDVRKVIENPAVFRNAGSHDPVRPRPQAVTDLLMRGLPPNELRSTLTMDGPEHLRIRRFLATIFTPRRIGTLEERTREITAELIDGIIAQGKADFVSDFAYQLPLILITRMLGAPAEDAERLHYWSSQKFSLQWGNLDEDEQLAAAQDYLDFQRYMQDLISQRRESRTDDVISALTFNAKQVDESPLREGELVAVLMGLIAAGHETTTNFMASTLLHAMEDRPVWDRMCRDPEYIPVVLEEGLRFDSPAYNIWRTTATEASVAGTVIPAGARVAVVLGSANRDERAFGDAASFCPAHNTEQPHVAFGRGMHFCLGAPLARLEGKVAFEELTRRIPSIRLTPGFKPSYAPNAVQRRLQWLPVEWDVTAAE
jgi:cytochrome P450